MNDRGCVGSIAEIYDSKAPYLPKGAIAQGWSVAEIFRIIYEKIQVKKCVFQEQILVLQLQDIA